MPVMVRIPPIWAKHAANRRDFALSGATVRELLANLAAECPELQERLYDSDGRITPAVAVFVNHDSINRLDGPDTPVADGDRVMLLMATAGG